MKKIVNRRMSNKPVNGLQNMPFHLGEHIIVIECAAHGLELLNRGYSVLTISIFCRYEQRTASYQLVVLFIDNTARTVPIEEVDCQE